MLRQILPSYAFLAILSSSSLAQSPDLSIFGPTFGTDCGTDVAIGDFNGDGNSDIAVLCSDYPYDDITIRLLWGGGSAFPAIVDLGAPALAQSTFHLYDQPSGFGLEQLDVVDMNDDGHDDIVYSSPYGGDKAKVIWGSPQFPAEADLEAGDVATTDFVWMTNDLNFGVATAGGDVDGDGFQDLIIGEPDASKVFVVHGASSFPFVVSIPGAPGSVTTIQETVAEWFTGISVDAGDIDKDGRDDILVGSYDDTVGNHFHTGKATLILGGNLVRGSTFTLQKTQTNITRFLSQNQYDELGSDVAFGDVDGDSFLDVILAARASSYAGDMYCGAAHVVFGQLDWDHLVFVDSGETPVTSIWGYSDNGHYGEPMTCGDVTGDVYAEVVLSGYSRRVASVLASSNMQPSIELETYDPEQLFDSDQIGDLYGRTVLIGDVSGDGIGDLLVTAKWYDGLGRNSSGAVFAYYGERATAIGDTPSLPPGAAARIMNYPNPFSRSTAITVTGLRGRESWIDVYDVSGRRVTGLPLTSRDNKASTTWDGTDASGRPCASGVYFARPRGESRFVGGRMLLLR